MNNSSVPELTGKMLRSASHARLGPFQLLLENTFVPLYCNEIIRILPRKRLVAFGKWGDKEVVAKLFYERRKAKHHWQRDVGGVDALLQANIPTPRLLYQGKAENKKIKVLLFEKIADAKNLEILWQEVKGTDGAKSLMSSVVLELATQHVLGIQQSDLHLKNFLVAAERVYTLDGGGIVKFPTILDKKLSLESLGLFFAQLGVGTEQLQQELYKVYATSRGWLIKQDDVDMLQKIVMLKNKERWQRYQKKVFRNCTAFAKMNKFNKSIMYDRVYRSSELLSYLYHPEKFFTQSNITLLKNGRTATVGKVFIDGRMLVVKRYNIKNSWHWLRRCLRATRAATSWRLAQCLSLMGVATAKPVAYIENHFAGLRGTSYLIMEYVAGQNIGEYFSVDPKENINLVPMAKRILASFFQLAELRITHGDLKMTNILLANEKPVLIDLDGMREHLTTVGFKHAFQKELTRFMKNWEKQPEVYELFKGLLAIRNIKTNKNKTDCDPLL
jgi:tRNA A-37 threonylcarbamoyl transferase component Bud32